MESMVNTHFWQDKKVLVTGHTGFKGSWLSLWLQSMGASVIGYSLEPPTQPSLFAVAEVATRTTSVIGDIRDIDNLRAVIEQYQPEIIFHLAAQSLVRYSYSNPLETYSTNIMGTVHLLESVRQIGGVKVIINVTSDKCYDNREWVWGYRENDPMGGYDPYSSSKGCAELVTSAYRSSFFNPKDFKHHGVALASARAGNVIGGGDWAQDRLIADLMHAFLASKVVSIRHPKSVRPWQHVLEPLSGYLLLAQQLWEIGDEYAESWNFGPADEDAKPVDWIVNYVNQLLDHQVTWVLDSVQHPHEAHYLKLDCSKAKSRLHWKPQWSLEQALQATVSWYKAYRLDQDMQAFTLKQISEYLKHNEYNH